MKNIYFKTKTKTYFKGLKELYYNLERYNDFFFNKTKTKSFLIFFIKIHI